MATQKKKTRTADAAADASKMVEVCINCNDGCVLCENAGNSFDVQVFVGGKPTLGFVGCYNCIMRLAADMLAGANDPIAEADVSYMRSGAEVNISGINKCLFCSSKKDMLDVQIFGCDGYPLTGFSVCKKCTLKVAAQMANDLNRADKYEAAAPKYSGRFPQEVK